MADSDRPNTREEYGCRFRASRNAASEAIEAMVAEQVLSHTPDGLAVVSGSVRWRVVDDPFEEDTGWDHYLVNWRVQ